MALPVRNLHTIGLSYDSSAVIISLVHGRIGSINILAVSNHSLERKVVHRKRDLESEFHSDVALIHSAHREVGEGVLGIVIEAHDLGLVLYGRIVTGDTDIIAGVAVRVVQVSGEGLDGLHVRNDGVAGPWRHESLVEGRRICHICHISINPVAASYDIAEVQFAGPSDEVLHLGLAKRCNRLIGNRIVGCNHLSVIGHRLSVGIESREKSLSHKTLSPELVIADTA